MKKLLVIGNGFDLRCGLSSKFSDFFERERKSNEDFAKFYDGLRRIDLFHFENWGGSPMDELVKKVNPLSINFSLFDALFLLLEWRDEVSPEDTRWCDIENVIFESLDPKAVRPIFSWKGVYNFLEQFHEYGKMVNSLIRDCGQDEMIIGYYLVCCHIFDLDKTEDRFSMKSFFSFVFSQLKLFEKRFARYILKSQTNFIEYLPKATELLKKLTDDHFDVDSFNFTTLPVDGSVSYLHGRADAGFVIFGISNVNISNKLIYPFTKESRQCDLLSLNIFPSNGTKIMTKS